MRILPRLFFKMPNPCYGLTTAVSVYDQDGLEETGIRILEPFAKKSRQIITDINAYGKV